MREVPDAEILAPEAFGLDELLAADTPFEVVWIELRAACLREIVPATAVRQTPARRRRAARAGRGGRRPRAVRGAAPGQAIEAELEGIRRAQRAAEAGMRAAACAAATTVLTVEEVKAASRPRSPSTAP